MPASTDHEIVEIVGFSIAIAAAVLVFIKLILDWRIDIKVAASRSWLLRVAEWMMIAWFALILSFGFGLFTFMAIVMSYLLIYDQSRIERVVWMVASYLMLSLIVYALMQKSPGEDGKAYGRHE